MATEAIICRKLRQKTCSTLEKQRINQTTPDPTLSKEGANYRAKPNDSNGPVVEKQHINQTTPDPSLSKEGGKLPGKTQW
jgi:hypothetical protein